jgi:hypothetical protein
MRAGATVSPRRRWSLRSPRWRAHSGRSFAGFATTRTHALSRKATWPGCSASFGIQPRTVWPQRRHDTGASSSRGYLRWQFEDAWRSYCDAEVTERLVEAQPAEVAERPGRKTTKSGRKTRSK